MTEQNKTEQLLKKYWNFVIEPIIKFSFYLKSKMIIIIGICIIAFYILSTCKNNNSLPSISLIIAFIVACIAYFQLKKTRESTNIQSLHAVINRYNSNEVKQKRAEFAKMILTKESTFTEKIEKLKEEFLNWAEKTELTIEDMYSIAKFKAQIEPIIYEFEIIGYFKKRGIYSLSDIYHLFSFEIQRYWLLIEEIGYINYLRFNKFESGEKDLYQEFQKLYENCISFEILGYDRQINISLKNAKELIEKKKGSLQLFLYEESLLLNDEK